MKVEEWKDCRGFRKDLQKPTFRALVLLWDNGLPLTKAYLRKVSSAISLLWPIYLVNSVVTVTVPVKSGKLQLKLRHLKEERDK